MLESKGKKRTKAFVKQIELLALNASDRIAEGFHGTEKELMQKFLTDTKEYIDYNECGVGLENLAANIYEINFRIDETAVALFKDAINACGMDYKSWAFIEELATP